jgi:DedD protein
MAGKKQEEDVDTLKRRGRRRLVGAVALVLLAVIVLPMVFDPEPRRSAPAVSVRIPGEDDSPFAPKVTPRPAEKKKAEEKKAEEKKAAVEEKKPVPEKKVPDTERTRAEAALAGGEFIVQVGAFANPKDVIAKLSAGKIPYYTEAAGNLTRVRAGPFATRAQAEKAVESLKAMGLKPGGVAAKS